MKVGLLCAAMLFVTAGARAQTVLVRVSSPRHDCRDVPVSVVVPEARLKGKKSAPGAIAVACQKEVGETAGTVRLTFLVPDLKQGQSAVYALTPSAKPAAGTGVVLQRTGENVDILVGGRLFTRYDTQTGPNKPYFYPVNGPTGAQIVRHYPLEKVAGETTDHPHHRGLWFAHASLNGIDFWTETAKKTGRTIHTGYGALDSGPVVGILRTRTDWQTPANAKIAEDTRDIRIYGVRDNGILMDITVTVKAIGGPLTWGDEKDGVLGLRVADSMRVDAGASGGKIENGRGDTQAKAWGKPAEWCDYSGPLDGQTVGIAILDNPANLRHPTPWHVRTYGLFAANPFGLHAFDPANKSDKQAGEYVTPEGKTGTFRYRLFFHRGDATQANIPDAWKSYADPPTIEIIGD